MSPSLPVTSQHRELIIICEQGKNQILSQMQNPGAGAPMPQDRRRDLQHRESDRRRISQQQVRAIPLSTIVSRNDLKVQRNQLPAALTPGVTNTPGQVTPLSAAAHVNVPISAHRASHLGTPQHPYASGGYDYAHGQNGQDDPYGSGAQQQPYGRASPMVSSAAPPAVSTVRARAGEVGVANANRDIGQDGEVPPPKKSIWDILCRCG